MPFGVHYPRRRQPLAGCDDDDVTSRPWTTIMQGMCRRAYMLL